MRINLRKTLLAFGVATWIASVAFGLSVLALRENTPGVPAEAGAFWPRETRLTRSSESWTLLMFVHPQCPCSAASVEELRKLLGNCRAEVQASVIFYRPRGFAEGWERTSLWDAASELRGVQLVCDDGEAERERFGVATSGQVLLYDRQGRLCYSGGVTRARGVGGDSRGGARLAAVLRSEAVGVAQADVFGCSLVSAKDERPNDRTAGAAR